MSMGYLDRKGRGFTTCFQGLAFQPRGVRLEEELKARVLGFGIGVGIQRC